MPTFTSKCNMMSDWCATPDLGKNWRIYLPRYFHWWGPRSSPRTRRRHSAERSLGRHTAAGPRPKICRVVLGSTSCPPSECSLGTHQLTECKTPHSNWQHDGISNSPIKNKSTLQFTISWADTIKKAICMKRHPKNGTFISLLAFLDTINV